VLVCDLVRRSQYKIFRNMTVVPSHHKANKWLAYGALVQLVAGPAATKKINP
jgi:hypothetical protein